LGALVSNYYNTVFIKGSFFKDCVVVIRNQGPQSNGMPELHSLNPILSLIQNLGYKIALITDGRMSGASCSVLTVVHISPETSEGGVISKIKNSDIIEIDAQKGTMKVKVSNDILNKRQSFISDTEDTSGYGRELFKLNRSQVSSSETGAISIN
jgi:phosphogluconate dehydratase